jgi:hypothetical protein
MVLLLIGVLPGAVWTAVTMVRAFNSFNSGNGAVDSRAVGHAMRLTMITLPIAGVGIVLLLVAWVRGRRQHKSFRFTQ